MTLNNGVTYLTDKIIQQQRLVDKLFWSAKTPQELLEAYREEDYLQQLTKLGREGEVYHVPF